MVRSDRANRHLVIAIIGDTLYTEYENRKWVIERGEVSREIIIVHGNGIGLVSDLCGRYLVRPNVVREIDPHAAVARNSSLEIWIGTW